MAERTDLTGITLELDHKYRVGNAVHRGPMATTYDGKWELFDLPVHIRSYEDLVKLRLRHRDTTRVRWAIETEAGKVRGPHLPDVIDAGIEDPTKPFLIMRLPEGEVLINKLKSQRLPVAEVVPIVRGVALALDHCREVGMPHRGPTADRVWLGDDGQVLLMGLGEVLYRDDTVSMSGATSPELLWHIPPESFTISLRRGEPDENSALRLRTRNAGTLQGRTLEDDPRAEVYALGCLAYHALNGHHPFFSSPDDATEGIHATIRDTPLELKDHAAHSDLWRVVSQAIAREPAERYATPLEFAEAFADSVALVDPSSVEPVVSSAGQSRPTFFRDPAGDGELSSEWSVPVKASDGFQLWAWRFTSAVLFGIVLFYMLQPRLEPRTLVVTSDPPQLHFGEQVGHTRVDLGTTPIVLRERSVTAPLRLFVIGPDGYGATTEFDISQFTDLGHCSSVTVPLTYPELVNDTGGGDDPFQALFAGSGDLEDEQED